jgi:hypothetical protein
MSFTNLTSNGSKTIAYALLVRYAHIVTYVIAQNASLFDNEGNDVFAVPRLTRCLPVCAFQDPALLNLLIYSCPYLSRAHA